MAQNMNIQIKYDNIHRGEAHRLPLHDYLGPNTKKQWLQYVYSQMIKQTSLNININRFQTDFLTGLDCRHI